MEVVGMGLLGTVHCTHMLVLIVESIQSWDDDSNSFHLEHVP